MLRKKLKSLKAIRKLVKELKEQKRKTVLAEGCFDILHVGHIGYLREAKKQGDFLFVAVNSDRTVKILKGKGRPVIPEKARAEIISSLAFVDYVFIFDSVSSRELIGTVKPCVYAKGTDYTVSRLIAQEKLKSFKGKIAIVGDRTTHKSSGIINSILKSG